LSHGVSGHGSRSIVVRMALMVISVMDAFARTFAAERG
jgi:hypothetical protein